LSKKDFFVKKTKVAFKQVIPPIFIMTCLVMVLAYQNCGPQKMLVTKVNGISSLCDTDPSRPECPQNFGQPTPTPPPIDPGTFGTCNPESLGWCVKYYNNTTQTGTPAAQYPLPRQDPPAHPGVEFSAHYVNGIPGANPLGVTANDWSMSAEVRWYPIAYSTLRFTIEYTGTVTYTFSAMSANGSTVTNTTTIESGTSVPANCTSAASCTYEIKNPDIAVSQPTGADFYLLKVVWSHSGTAPAHLRIVTPAAPGSSPTPTPTPTGSPGGATPTPTPPPNPISGRLLWNVSYIAIQLLTMLMVLCQIVISN
jgi:hypothetical protein